MGPKNTPCLSMLVITDLWRYKWVVLLWLALMTTCFSRIWVVQSSRTLTIEMNQLYDGEHALEQEWQNMILEENAKKEPHLVMQQAQQQLDMHVPQLQSEQFISIP